MDWLQSIDVATFRLVNQAWRNSWCDVLMPFISGNVYFVPALLSLSVGLLWKGGARGRLFVLMMVLAWLVGDAVIVSSLKRWLGRPRPFLTLADVHLLVGMGGSASMPSGHAANWFAAAVFAFTYYRRTVWFMLPLAAAVAYSRMYVGVHYPSDVLAGSLLGAAYAFGGLRLLNALWQAAGQTWFPLWWAQMPSLINPIVQSPPAPALPDQSPSAHRKSAMHAHWLRLGYVFIGVALIGRLIYIGANRIELSEDEAYQWVWSKHLALSYYSKPPLIAYTQWLGTRLWGDTAFGVRFFSPVIGAVLSCLLLRFVSREVSARAGFFLLLIISTTPLMAVGATLMTIDPLSVLFWTAAMLAGWLAVQKDSTPLWLWTGLWIGLGFLSKYIGLFQWLCWAVFFVLHPPARAQLRRPGPYLAVFISLLCTLPVLIWNQQHDWITMTHLADRGGLMQAWKPTLRFFWDFLFAEIGLLNPVYFVAACVAGWGLWQGRERQPLQVFLFSMGAPLFLFYAAYTLRARVLPNWIAPAVLPLFCLAVIYWHPRWRHERKWTRGAIWFWLRMGLGLGIVAVTLLHDTNLIQKVSIKPLPAELDPLRRVRGWKESAQVIGEARTKMQAEGKPVFLIGDHYGITGLLSFYLPEAKTNVTRQPLVYYRSSEKPDNQFYFWPGYGARKGENAIYVQQTKTPVAPPERLLKEFSTVTDLGMFEVPYRGRVFHRFQLFACRDLR